MTDTRGILSVVLNRRELVVPSEADDLRYLRHHWAAVYIIIPPSDHSSLWGAAARFGSGDELIAGSADELLGMMHRHYGPHTEGYTEMLMDRLGKKFT